VALTPEMIAVHPSVPVKTLAGARGVLEEAAGDASSSGNGGLPHLAIELLKNVSKGNFLHVAVQGRGPAVIDTLGGHVNGVVMDLPAVATQVKDGKLRALAVTTSARRRAPDVPTTGDAGAARHAGGELVRAHGAEGHAGRGS
jgi:tripartite-type tricarboxylate transporter receptor subunit TctC